MNEAGKLSIVSTPIGNLEDITLRALRTLKECDVVLCEDTRVTGKLLAHYEIKKPLRRYDAHASDGVHANIVSELLAGQHMALVSDAGTPGISDPGVQLVRQARAEGITIEAIPGPSAVTTVVSLAGISGNQFTFLGFIPHKKGRETFFKKLQAIEQPAVFFESTHRIIKTLTSLVSVVPENTIYVGRELTKMYEELLVGKPQEILDILQAEPVRQKGEFVLIIENQK